LSPAAAIGAVPLNGGSVALSPAVLDEIVEIISS